MYFHWVVCVLVHPPPLYTLVMSVILSGSQIVLLSLGLASLVQDVRHLCPVKKRQLQA